MLIGAKMMVCEICRGSDFVKRDGEFVCVKCGTRYPLEEAQKLYVGTDTKYGSEVADRIKNYIELAIQARNAGANFEAEVYCNKALELDANNYQAWRIKAEVVCAQSSGDEDWLREAIAYYGKALEVAPEEFKENLRKESGKTVAIALRERASRYGLAYAKSASKADGDVLLLLPHYTSDATYRMSIATDVELLDDGLRVFVANTMNNSAIAAWNRVIAPRYANDQHRNKAAMDAFISGGDEVIAIILKAIGFCPGDKEGNKSRYKNLVSLQEQLIDAHSMREDGNRWVRAYSLSDENKARRRSDIAEWQAALREIDPDYRPVPVANMPAVSDQESGKKSVWNRIVNWKTLVSLLCITRGLTLMSSPSSGMQLETLAWLGMGIAFAVWWYQSD